METQMPNMEFFFSTAAACHWSEYLSGSELGLCQVATFDSFVVRTSPTTPPLRRVPTSSSPPVFLRRSANTPHQLLLPLFSDRSGANFS